MNQARPARARGAGVTARELWVALESIHAVTYFAPACRDALRRTGLKGFWAGYFASRAAPLGKVGSGTVTAAFFNFHPGMVAAAIPACWLVADPAELTVLRAGTAAEVLPGLCGGDPLEGLVGVLPHLRAASARCDSPGRIMAGANRGLWPVVGERLRAQGLPEDQLGAAEVWQACTTLREHRGDGHVAALVSHGVSGLEAHLLASGVRGVPLEVLRDNRGWSEQDWSAAAARLGERGLLRADGAATPAGETLLRDVESVTDDLAGSAYETLCDEDLHELSRALGRCATPIQASGIFPFPNPMGLPRIA